MQYIKNIYRLFNGLLYRIWLITSRCLTFVVLYMVNLYRYIISPMLPQSCIFYPTCSEYAIQALKQYNAIKAIFLAAKRLSKCHSFYKGNKYDPLP